MSTVRLGPLDTAWLFTESRATPNHVGGLLQFRLPQDAPKDYLRQLMAEFRSHRTFSPPWNRRLKFAFNKNPVPAWVENDEIDLEYHVRHAALPWPGGERELGELVGRLQSTPLDLARPPWECTIVEGLSDNRFALFIKMHHSLIDGVSGMKLLERAMATDAKKSLALPPFWDASAAAVVRLCTLIRLSLGLSCDAGHDALAPASARRFDTLSTRKASATDPGPLPL